METKERAIKILESLDKYFDKNEEATLDHRNAWELLQATILSAQCTDKRVNMVTPELFSRYPGPEDLAEAKISDVESLIHSVGFYHAKAKNLIACARMIVDDYRGQVPSSLEELTSLPGVGRKTANVIRGNIYKIPSIVVDTHVKRISKKMGLTKETDPVKVELDLYKVLPEDHWIKWNLYLINLGRTICKAKDQRCSECPVGKDCASYKPGK